MLLVLFASTVRMDPKKVERIKKRKADEEDEFIFLIFLALYLHLLNSKVFSSTFVRKKHFTNVLTMMRQMTFEGEICTSFLCERKAALTCSDEISGPGFLISSVS